MKYLMFLVIAALPLMISSYANMEVSQAKREQVLNAMWDGGPNVAIVEPFIVDNIITNSEYEYLVRNGILNDE